METLKFKLSGNGASYLKPQINSVNLTYSHIHKPALLGMLGAALGLKGHNQKLKEEEYPEYYEKLKGLKVSIVPTRPYFPTTMNHITETNGFANRSGSQGLNLVIKEQRLDSPEWTILIQKGNAEESTFEKLKDFILNSKNKFSTYLGKNHFTATIEDMEIINLEKTLETSGTCNSLIIDRDVEVIDSFSTDDDLFVAPFSLPVAYRKFANYYREDKMIITNNELEWDDSAEMYNIDGKNCLFF